MFALRPIAVIALLTASACAADPEASPSDERADSSEVIEHRLPDAPTPMDVAQDDQAASTSQSIAYGHCDAPETADDGVITVNCDAKWSEVAWFNVSADVVDKLIGADKHSLALQVEIKNSTIEEDSVRLSIHGIGIDGASRKLLSEPNLFSSDSVEISLDDTSYQIYVARGENSSLIWGDGVIEFSLSASAR